MSPLRGMLVLLAASVSFGVMAFLVKIVTQNVPGAQVALVRFLVSFAPLLLVPSIRRASMKVARVRPLVVRGIFGGLAVLLYFTAIRHIPVGVAALLNTTSPLFSGVFAAIFLGERLRARVVVPFIVALMGIFIVVRGHATSSEVFGFGQWELTALASAFCAGIALTAIRGARRTEGTWTTVSALSLFGLLTITPMAAMQWTTPSLADWTLMIAAGVLALIGQLLMTWAYRWVETLIAGVISQFTVIVAMALGVAFLADELNLFIIAGASLTISGVVSVIALSRGRMQNTEIEPAGGA